MMIDGTGHSDQVAGKAFSLPATQDGSEGDGVFPEPEGPVHGGGEMELQDTVRFAFQDIAAGLEGLDDAVPHRSRVTVHVDLPFLVAEEGIDERHHDEDGEDPPDRGPAMLERHGHVLGHHPGKHQDSDDEREDERHLDEILDGSAKVGHL